MQIEYPLYSENAKDNKRNKRWSQHHHHPPTHPPSPPKKEEQKGSPAGAVSAPVKDMKQIKVTAHLQRVAPTSCRKKSAACRFALASFCRCRLSACVYSFSAHRVTGLSRLEFQRTLCVCVYVMRYFASNSMTGWMEAVCSGWISSSSSRQDGWA